MEIYGEVMIVDEHKTTFLGREWTREQHLANALATVIDAAKLIERARSGDPAEADDNATCAASWLRVAAAELEGQPRS